MKDKIQCPMVCDMKDKPGKWFCMLTIDHVGPHIDYEGGNQDSDWYLPRKDKDENIHHQS